MLIEAFVTVFALAMLGEYLANLLFGTSGCDGRIRRTSQSPWSLIWIYWLVLLPLLMLVLAQTRRAGRGGGVVRPIVLIELIECEGGLNVQMFERAV